MKKLIILFLVPMLILTSCSKKTQNNTNNTNNNTNNNKPEVLTIDEIYPFSENTKYVYEGQGNEYASYTVYTDYIRGSRVQTRTNNGGTEVVKVMEKSNGELRELLSRGETYFRYDFTGTDKTGGEILLKEPLEKGKSWAGRDNSTRTITNTNVQVETPFSKFNTIEITTTRNGTTTTEYYAKGVGLVKTISKGEGYEVSSTLSKVEKSAPFVQSVRVFYPSTDEMYLLAKDVEISFNTNEDVRDVIEKTIKSVKEYRLMSDNAKINSIVYEEAKNAVRIDFSKEFVSEMNAGSGFEAMILQSVTNTAGVYYGVEDVYITVDKKAYESGHILLKTDEPLKVKLDNVKMAE
jgi:hypothetical protein